MNNRGQGGTTKVGRVSHEVEERETKLERKQNLPEAAHSVSMDTERLNVPLPKTTEAFTMIKLQRICRQ